MSAGFGPSPIPSPSPPVPSPIPIHVNRRGSPPEGLEELHRLELEFVNLTGGQAGFLYVTFLRGTAYYIFVDHWRTTDLEDAEWHLRHLTDKVRRGERPWEL